MKNSPWWDTDKQEEPLFHMSFTPPKVRFPIGGLGEINLPKTFEVCGEYDTIRVHQKAKLCEMSSDTDWGLTLYDYAISGKVYLICNFRIKKQWTVHSKNQINLRLPKFVKFSLDTFPRTVV